MGATADGKKELIAVMDGYRESEQSWTELLVDLKHRGLTTAPKIAVGDGGAGLLGRVTETVPRDAGTTMLGAQDGQCPQQAAEERAAQGEGGPP